MGRCPDCFDIAFDQATSDLVENFDGFLSGFPLDWATQQILLGHHLEDRADVLSHPAMDQHQRILQGLSGFGGDLLFAEHGVGRQQTSAANAKLGVGFGSCAAAN